MPYTEQFLEGRFIVGHQVVDNDQPLLEGVNVHLEEGGIEQQLHRGLLPHGAHVVEGAHRGQELRARQEEADVAGTKQYQYVWNFKMTTC